MTGKCAGAIVRSDRISNLGLIVGWWPNIKMKNYISETKSANL